MVQLCDMFPDEDSARDWFETHVWPDGRYCPHCGSVNTHEAGPQSHALSLHGLSWVFQREDRNRHGQLASSLAQVGIRDLPAPDKPQVAYRA